MPFPIRSMFWVHVFKIVSDPFVGKLGVFRSPPGNHQEGNRVVCRGCQTPVQSWTPVPATIGKDYVEVDALVPGDIGAIAKVDEIDFDCVLQ